MDGSPAGVLAVVKEVVVTTLLTLVWFVFGAFRSMTPYSWWPHKRVRGEVVLVTGAGNGLGRLLAKEFAKREARMVLWDVNDQGNQETAELCRQVGAQDVWTYTVDLNSRDNTYDAGARTLADVGKVDILVNNAGIVHGKSIFDLTDEQIERSFHINAISHFWTAKIFLPGMWESNHGHIVGISSAAGTHGTPMLTDYCSSKFAVNGFYQSIFAKTNHENKSGVNVTYVCPCYMNTGMFTGVSAMVAMPVMAPEDVASQIVSAILTNQVMVMIPKIGYWLCWIKTFSPIEVDAILSKAFKMYDSMQGFVGRNVNGQHRTGVN